MNKDTFKRYFLILLMAVAGCQSEQKRQETTSSDEALIFAKNIFGDKVKIAVRGDLNSNNKKDALALVINRQIDEMKFWIQKGGVVEKNDDTWKVLLRIDEKVYNSAGPIKEIPESKDGYILSFSMEQNPISLKVAASDSKGQAVSAEFPFKWNEMDGKYELEKK